MEACVSQKFHATLPMDTKHYQQCYQTFSRFLQFDQPYEPWYNRVLGAAIRDKLGGQTMAALMKDEPLRHLGVGSGSGKASFSFSHTALIGLRGRMLSCTWSNVIMPRATVLSNPPNYLRDGVVFS